jgi:lysophospholipase-2
MPAWFDLYSLDPSGQEDDRGIEKSKTAIIKIIEEEINNGIDPSRIVLGGFSQGGALALYTGLTCKYKLAGLIGLSCWLPLNKTFPGAMNSTNADMPVMQAHGDCDPVVPYLWGQLTSTVLKGFLKSHEFKTYKGLAHSSGAGELQDIKTKLQGILPPEK